MADGAYDEDLTPEEEAQLQQEEGAATAAPAPAPAEEAKEPATPAPPPPPPPAPAPTDEEEYQAFLKKHEGKTPEEIARLAYQQTKRASRGEFEARRAGETLDSFQKRLASALEDGQARRAALAERSRAFKEQLERDPDAAVKLAFDSNLEREAADIERDEDNARIDAAISLASQAIPDFREVFPDIQAFGQEMGYSKEELGAIRDGRDIITLYCARGFANLFKAGIVDLKGNLLQTPEPVASTDPRLTRRPASRRSARRPPAPRAAPRAPSSASPR
jgi:hypothetical protein